MPTHYVDHQRPFRENFSRKDPNPWADQIDPGHGHLQTDVVHPRAFPFAEPGTFAVNAEGKLHLIEISNTPFNRADLAELLETVEWIQAENYPIRGTHA